jgi:hypothetical protein
MVYDSQENCEEVEDSTLKLSPVEPETVRRRPVELVGNLEEINSEAVEM